MISIFLCVSPGGAVAWVRLIGGGDGHGRPGLPWQRLDHPARVAVDGRRVVGPVRIVRDPGLHGVGQAGDQPGQGVLVGVGPAVEQVTEGLLAGLAHPAPSRACPSSRSENPQAAGPRWSKPRVRRPFHQEDCTRSRTWRLTADRSTPRISASSVGRMEFVPRRSGSGRHRWPCPWSRRRRWSAIGPPPGGWPGAGTGSGRARRRRDGSTNLCRMAPTRSVGLGHVLLQAGISCLRQSK